MDGDDPGGPWGDPGDEGSDDKDHFRGWISPDDRLWRHPSEAMPSSSSQSPEGTDVSLAAHRGRSGAWIVGGTTLALIVALVAVGLIIVTTDTNESSSASHAITLTRAPTTEPGTGRLESSNQMAAVIAAVRPSTVALLLAKRSGTIVSTGLVAESGGVIVTAADPLSGARSITVVEPGGSRQVAAVIGVDETSGLAVVRIGDDLPAATFDDDDPAPGDVTLALAMQPARRAGGTPAPRVYAGTVLSSGQPLAAGSLGADFAPTAVATPLTEGDLGSPLLDASGEVAGLLESVSTSGAITTSVFLPADVVLGVVHQIVASGSVDHGWFGIAGDADDATTTTSTLTETTASPSPIDGAPVEAVESGSPAAEGGLEAGDLVIALDGDQVHSMAELRARLYAEPPGATLEVTFERDGAVENTTVVLGDSTDAQGDGTSP